MTKPAALIAALLLAAPAAQRQDAGGRPPGHHPARPHDFGDYVLACADDAQKLDESNEGNNCRASATTVVVR